MYDVFISYKKHDEHGVITEDALIAQKLYSHLKKAGLSVFFSEESLGVIGSSRYKNDIDTALDKSKAMVVVLTKPEYAFSQWVEYEWDSFYGDYLSGLRASPCLYTFSYGFEIKELPRTLRNVNNFDAESAYDELTDFICAALNVTRASLTPEPAPESRFSVLTGKSIRYRDIEEAVSLDYLVYDETFYVSPQTCYDWFCVNPDIYVMLRDNTIGRIVSYINVSPVTEDCYEKIRSGHFIDTGITADMILSYNMPYPYYAYFSSVVIHPEYQNTAVIKIMFDAIVEKFIALGEQEIYIKKMIADAVSPEGEKFCRLFGMKKVDDTNHGSGLYEVSLIPPEFRVTSKMTKKLYEYYNAKFQESPFLFEY